MGGVINKPAAAAKSLAFISLLQQLDAFCSWCPQTRLWWTQSYKWDRRGFSQEPYELYGPSSLDFLCSSSSPFFFRKINISASENRHGGCNSKTSEVHFYLWDCRGNSTGACVLCLSMWSKQTGSMLKFRNVFYMYHKLPSGQYIFWITQCDLI
jgi:hypothetical protein